MPRSVVRALLSAACCAVASSAAAQAGFVQAGYGVEIRRFSAEPSERVFDSSVPSVSIAAGAFLTSVVTAAIELDFGGSATVARTVRVALAGQPTAITTQYTLERRTVSALFGLQTSAVRRVRLGVHAGVSFSAFRREIASDAPPIVLTDPPAPAVFTDRTVGPVAAVDVAVRVARQIALVAALRADGLRLSGDLNGFSLRPSGAVRISF